MNKHIYEKACCDVDLSRFSFLVTGGAGFIGSNLVDYLMRHGAGKVRVLDNLSEGRFENIEPYIGDVDFEFMQGDVTDWISCVKACEGVDFVSHQAALGSVPRSVARPLDTNHANVTGFLTLMHAAKEANVKRFVYASSSSVYGDSPDLPKVEGHAGAVLSPYAASKAVNEIYANVFALNYGMQVIGLRYFNIFGPQQKPDGPYAAVIPLFMKAIMEKRPPTIFGNGEQSRDFTFVANAVQANIKAMCFADASVCGQAYNVACGERVTINQLFQMLKDIAGSSLTPEYAEPRQGDIPHSLADISSAQSSMGYSPEFDLKEGLEVTFSWFQSRFES